eukprot:TRINITY_DN3672_c0_g1_i1.p1 TRINITY_DN3672_c0_g1~~TRINITY_DN3672_c0_g1_i1.p1  ORF type:complete len:278 (+),score=37.63 TRINITY_DN3672_c0_g1_i1:88-921(+)
MTSALTAELTEGTALQQFVVLAKSSKGKAVSAIIGQATGAPNVFVFGELLELPTVQQLAGTEESKFLELLKIFAYGSFSDYKAAAAELPELSVNQSRKLKQLSIVSLAFKDKVIPYAVLQQALDIAEVRELEDLIIDSIYQGVIAAKLDQRQSQLEVEYTMGRDLRPAALDEMVQILGGWHERSIGLLQTIKQKIAFANDVYEQEKKKQEEHQKLVETAKANLKAMMIDSEMLQGEDMDIAFDVQEKGRRGRTSKKAAAPRDHHGGGFPGHKERRNM